MKSGGLETEKGFQTFKDSLTNLLVLGFSRPEGRYILGTDASGKCIAGLLSQEDDGREVVISYARNTLNRVQWNYCAIYPKLLAVVVYTNKFRHNLLGTHFIVRTDHASLTWLMGFKNPDNMLAHWLMKLQTMGVKDLGMVQNCPGRKHINADALFRLPYSCCKGDNCTDCSIHRLVTAKLKY